MKTSYEQHLDSSLSLIAEERAYLEPLEREIEGLRGGPWTVETLNRYSYLTHKVSSGMA